MNDKQMEKFISYTILAIIGSYIVQEMIPFLVWSMIGMVVWRFYLAGKFK